MSDLTEKTARPITDGMPSGYGVAGTGYGGKVIYNRDSPQYGKARADIEDYAKQRGRSYTDENTDQLSGILSSIQAENRAKYPKGDN